MSTPADGGRQEHLKNQAFSPYRMSGRVEIGYFGDQPLSHVRLVGACGETVDEFWLSAGEARQILARLVKLRRGQKS